MTKTATAKPIGRLHAHNPADAAWRARQTQVDADIEGLSRDAGVDLLVADMDASGVGPRKQIENLKTHFRHRQMGHAVGGA